MPHSEDLKLTERFTRIDPEMINYVVTVEDPRTFEEPWTYRLTLTTQPGYEVLEYSCHEGNFFIANALRAEKVYQESVREAMASGQPIPQRPSNISGRSIFAPPPLSEAVDINAEEVMSLCPCCQFQLRVSQQKKDIPVKVTDLAAFACRGLGKEFKDPHPEVQRQWAVFEAMIALMTPKGFAELMSTMWPEMLDAMPMGMGKMMRAIGKMGFVGDAMFALMKPVFPILFPKLLPGMMPKVMPTMLARVAEQIPMPEYMAEQMPDLMPKVMDNLMPHMLPDVVPLAVPKMIDFLRSRTAA